MSLSARLTVLLAGVLALGALVGDRLLRGHFERHFGSVERVEAEETARLARRAIEQETDDLGRDAAQIAWSDQLHASLAQPSATLDGALLLPAVLSAAGLDVVAILEPHGRVRHLHVRHPDHPDVTALRVLPSEAVNLTQIFGRGLDWVGASDERGVLASGLVATESGPLLIAARNIVPASHDEPRRGIVVVGRFLGAGLEQQLERRLGFGVDVWPVGRVSMPPELALVQDRATASHVPIVVTVSDERLDVYTTLDDVRKRPEFLVRTVLTRDVSAAAGLAIRSGLLSSLSLSLGLLLALLVALRAFVLRPIAALSRSVVHIGENEDFSIRVDDGRDDELGALAAEFNRMIERLEEARRQVIETARAAGMSEIAMGILHNVGNVLNSVNISASLLSERVHAMCLDDLAGLTEVLRQKGDDLATFLTQDPQGMHLQPFLSALVDQLASDREHIAREVEALSTGLEHVCELVKSQQGLARRTQVTERVAVERLVADAVSMTAGARAGKALTVEIDVEEDLPTLLIDRNKALEIIVNLLQNARQSIDEFGPRPSGHRLTMRAHRRLGGKLRIEVRDTGVGIDQELMTRIFQLGFTTKAKGSGLGLHTAANGARSLGGSLSVESAGRGQGATFVLELPFGERSEREAA
jgi:signal transduction histidine kinase